MRSLSARWAAVNEPSRWVLSCLVTLTSVLLYRPFAVTTKERSVSLAPPRTRSDRYAHPLPEAIARIGTIQLQQVGGRLALGSWDTTALVWDRTAEGIGEQPKQPAGEVQIPPKAKPRDQALPTGAHTRLRGQGSVRAVAFSTDGKLLASAHDSGTCV